jgi:hypothetical protein
VGLAVTASALDWVSAISSVISALGVAVAIVLLFPQLREFRSNAAERERSVAVKVTAWAEKRDDKGRWIVAHNASDRPVYEVRLWLIRGDPVPEQESEPPWNRRPTAQRAVLTPHDDLRYRISAAAMRTAAPLTRPPVEIVFRDDSERWWWRDAMGRLVRLSREQMRGQGVPPESSND